MSYLVVRAMNKIALYIRLSVEERSGRDESESITNQKLYLTEYLRSHEDFKRLPYEEYIDDGYSGTNTNRPAFMRMMEEVKMGGIKTIIVKDMSRFMRDYISIGNYLENIFPFMGLRFIAINDGYDSSKEQGNGTELDVQFKNLLYDFYAKDVSDKVKSVSNALKKQGKFLAWAPPFGYIKDSEDKHKIVVDEVVAPIIRRIFSMYVEGLSTRQIAKVLNSENAITPSERKKQITNMDYAYKMTTTKSHKKSIWMHGTVINILANESYVGTYCYNTVQQLVVGGKNQIPVPREEWGRIYNHHEPIISQGLFDKVQDIKAKKTFKNVDYSKLGKVVKNPTQGYVTCKTCGHTLSYSTTIRPNGTRHEYFFCRTCKMKDSPRKNIKAKDAEMKAFESIKGIMKFEKIVTVNEDNKPLIPFDKQIETLEEKKELAFNRYKQGKLEREDFIKFKKSTDEEIEELNHLVVKPPVSMKEVSKSDSLTREMVERYINKISVDPRGKIEVMLKD